MVNIINIGIPSKGRLRKDVLKIFKKKKLNLVSERGERDLIGSIKNKKNIKILYLHAREIIERLGDNSLDIGFSGFDLFKESEINIQKKINVNKKLSFGKADLVVAIPNPWIDFVMFFLNLLASNTFVMIAYNIIQTMIAIITIHAGIC